MIGKKILIKAQLVSAKLPRKIAIQVKSNVSTTFQRNNFPIIISLVISLIFRLYLAAFSPMVPDESLLILDSRRIAEGGLTIDRILFDDAGTFTVRGFLTPLIYSMVYTTIESLLLFRLLAITVSYIGIIFVYALFRKFVDEEAAKYVLCLILLDPFVVRWLGVYVLSESFFFAAIWAAMFFLWRDYSNPSKKDKLAAILVSGICISIRILGIFMVVFTVAWLLGRWIFSGIKNSDPIPVVITATMGGFALMGSHLLTLIMNKAPWIFSGDSTIAANFINYVTQILFRWNDFRIPEILIPFAFLLAGWLLIRTLGSIQKTSVLFLILMIFINTIFYMIIPTPTLWTFRYLAPVVTYPLYLFIFSSFENSAIFNSIGRFSPSEILPNKIFNRKILTMIIAAGLLLATIPVGASNVSKYSAVEQTSDWLHNENTSKKVLSNIGEFLIAYNCPQEIIAFGKYDLTHKEDFFNKMIDEDIRLLVLVGMPEVYANHTKYLETPWIDSTAIVTSLHLIKFDDSNTIVNIFQIEIQRLLDSG